MPEGIHRQHSTGDAGLITRNEVGTKAVKVTPRKPLPDAANTALHESAAHVIEAEKILETLASVIPAAHAAEYFEALYHLEASLRWHQTAGAKLQPDVL
jgi:hypothetical protein